MSTKSNDPVINQFASFIKNEMTMRSMVIGSILDRKVNIDQECGYPDIITPQMYRGAWEREGIAKRVVNIYPEECFAMDPEILESEDDANTPFEEDCEVLNEQFNFIHYLQRLDEVSGICTFGAALIGLNDRKDLDKPVDGFKEDGTIKGEFNSDRKILFIRTFDETMVQVDSTQEDMRNPRFGQPLYYNLQLVDPISSIGVTGASVQRSKSVKVHWSRIVHAADGCMGDNGVGTPRMKSNWNRLYDCRKILSGSAEMLWKGGFPGYTAEVNPDIASEADFDADSIREQFRQYQAGLQRILAISGVTIKSLASQVADPTQHIAIQLKAIAMAIGVPYRVLIGSEEARLSSTQDTQVWNKRLARRQARYITPFLIRPFINRLIGMGVVHQPEKLFRVKWPDLNTMTDEQKADVAVKTTTALVQYVSGMVETVMAPKQFFMHVLGFNSEVTDMLITTLEAHLKATGMDGLTGLLAQKQSMLGNPLTQTGGKSNQPNSGNTDIQSTGRGGV